MSSADDTEPDATADPELARLVAQVASNAHLQSTLGPALGHFIESIKAQPAEFQENPTPEVAALAKKLNSLNEHVPSEPSPISKGIDLKKPLSQAVLGGTLDRAPVFNTAGAMAATKQHNKSKNRLIWWKVEESDLDEGDCELQGADKKLLSDHLHIQGSLPYVLMMICAPNSTMTSVSHWINSSGTEVTGRIGHMTPERLLHLNDRYGAHTSSKLRPTLLLLEPYQEACSHGSRIGVKPDDKDRSAKDRGVLKPSCSFNSSLVTNPSPKRASPKPTHPPKKSKFEEGKQSGGQDFYSDQEVK